MIKTIQSKLSMNYVNFTNHSPVFYSEHFDNMAS